MTQPSNKAPESPSPHGLSDSDIERIHVKADEYRHGIGNHDGSAHFDFFKGSEYATLYEREQSAQLRAEVEHWKWHYDGVNETRQAQAEEIKRLKEALSRCSECNDLATSREYAKTALKP